MIKCWCFTLLHMCVINKCTGTPVPSALTSEQSATSWSHFGWGRFGSGVVLTSNPYNSTLIMIFLKNSFWQSLVNKIHHYRKKRFKTHSEYCKNSWISHTMWPAQSAHRPAPSYRIVTRVVINVIKHADNPESRKQGKFETCFFQQ